MEQADAFSFPFAPANVSACGERNLSSIRPQELAEFLTHYLFTTSTEINSAKS
jgi:hypothetical protein